MCVWLFLCLSCAVIQSSLHPKQSVFQTASPFKCADCFWQILTANHLFFKKDCGLSSAFTWCGSNQNYVIAGIKEPRSAACDYKPVCLRGWFSLEHFLWSLSYESLPKQLCQKRSQHNYQPVTVMTNLFLIYGEQTLVICTVVVMKLFVSSAKGGWWYLEKVIW